MIDWSLKIKSTNKNRIEMKTGKRSRKCVLMPSFIFSSFLFGWRHRCLVVQEEGLLETTSAKPELTMGAVTALTPSSSSLLTDISVGCLPKLFLAYCTITNTSSPDSCPDSRAIPDMMADDPMPLVMVSLRP